MYAIVQLVDGTFDLIGSIKKISYVDNQLEFETDLNTGYSYTLDIITDFSTITYKEYCMLSSCEKCNHDFYL